LSKRNSQKDAPFSGGFFVFEYWNLQFLQRKKGFSIRQIVKKTGRKILIFIEV